MESEFICEEGEVSEEEPNVLGAQVLRQASAILRAGPICDECLGRAFARLGHGLSNGERGRALRTVARLLGIGERGGACWVCEDLFARVDDWARRAASLAEGIEYETYLVGVKVTPRLSEAEHLFKERFPTGLTEPLKHAFNREVGKAFEKETRRGTLALESPHLWFTANLAENGLSLRVLPLTIYGRYRKLVRGIPQTHWPCGRCRGRGCPACGETGRQYPESVEELIAPPFLEAAGASGARLHGAGREDIDARMLGSGRPFVLELVSPRSRRLDVASLERVANASALGKVEVAGLRLVSGEMVARIKEAEAQKTYRALVRFGEGVTTAGLRDALGGLVGRIEQRTPRRVAHRRADLVRGRRVLEATGGLLTPERANLTLRCDGGLYIKELVSGDEGRTRPSLASLLGVAAQVIELDVVDVASGAFPDGPNGGFGQPEAPRVQFGR